jgi:hypothetical protein
MRKTLVLVATFGAFAMLVAPATAGDYRPHPTSSFGLGIFVWPAPKTVHHYYPRPWHLRPQPVYRFAHPHPRPTWHHWHRPQPRHFDGRHHGHSQWRHGDQRWRHGHAHWRGGDHHWRGGDQHRGHGDHQWRDRSGRDHERHDRRH